MLERIKKLAAESGSHFTFADYAIGIGKWVWTLVGTAVLAGLAALTPWLESASPFGWFLIGLAGVLLLACVVALASVLIARALARLWPSRAMISSGAPSVGPESPAGLPAAQPEQTQPTVRAVDLESDEVKRAKHRLVMFAAEFVLPACARQQELQDAAIQRFSRESSVMGQVARDGIRSGENARKFIEARERLKVIVDNSAKNTPFEKVMRTIDILARYLEPYSQLSVWLFHGTGFDIKKETETAQLYEVCKSDADLLSAQYRQFTNDPTYTLIHEIKPRPRLGEQFVTSM